MTTHTPIEREEMRAIRRELINTALHMRHEGIYFVFGMRRWVRIQEYYRFGYVLRAYKGFKP